MATSLLTGLNASLLLLLILYLAKNKVEAMVLPKLSEVTGLVPFIVFFVY